METNNMNELREVFEVIGEKVPQLVKSLLGSVFAPETAQSMGKAVGLFYQSLVENGVPKEDALKMAKDYAGSMNDMMRTGATEFRAGAPRHDRKGASQDPSDDSHDKDQEEA